MSVFSSVKARFPDCSDETIQRYLDLREEGHTRYQALLMAGMTDPNEMEIAHDDEQQAKEDFKRGNWRQK